LTEVNVAEPKILGLQASQQIKGILGTAPNQGLATAHPGAGHPEMPKEEPVASRSLLKAPVELIELPGEGLTQTVLVASYFSFPGIRENRDGSVTQLNELRLGAKIYGMNGLGACQNV
jgi:hypothetical protein